MPDIADGATHLVSGSSGTPYQLKNVGGAYSCSCPGWRNQSRDPHHRTCKHLLDFRGEAIEAARILPGGRSNMPGTISRRVERHWNTSGGTAMRHPTTTTRLAAPEPPPSVWGRLASHDDVFDDGPAPASTVPEEVEPTAKEAFQVLLAETWDGNQNTRGMLMSEKLDGVRAYWNGTDFISRLGNRFHAPEWFTRNLPEMALDGELYMGRGRFQETVSIVRRQGGESEDWGRIWDQLSFMCFDAPDMPGMFNKRYESLLALRPQINNQWFSIVEHTPCSSRVHLDRFLREVEDKGGEGVMLRDWSSLYVRGRSSTLLKVKSFYDAEATIVGHSPGKGRHAGRLGAYICETRAATITVKGKPFLIPRGKRFNVGTGLSDSDRNNPLPIGTVITYRFQEFTKDTIPRFPSFVGRRGDVLGDNMREQLQEWISAQVVSDEMRWKGAWGRQVKFARDVIGSVLAAGLDYEDRQEDFALVISTHRSKSIVLPVYEFSRPDLGLRVILRQNFYNWKLSVISETPIEADFSGLFPTTFPVEPAYTGNSLAPCYFEGFPEELIFGYYEASDKRHFSAEIWSDEELWTTLFLIMRSIGAIRPHVWSTKASHRAELDADTARRKAREAAKTA